MNARIVVLALVSLLFGIGIVVGCGPQTTPGDETPAQETTAKVEKTNGEEPTVEPDASLTEPTVEPVPDRSTPPEPTVQEEPAQPEPEPVVEAEPVVEEEPKPVSYHKDIRSVVQQRCLGCHDKNGIGPFELTSYASIKTRQALIRDAIQKRRMPPWLADNTCNDYKNNFDLSDQERDMIIKWIDDGLVEGDPKDYKEPPPPGQIGLPRVDVSLKMTKPYTPKSKPDDYRCFVLDWPHKTDKFLTGFQVKPGNPKLVHHIIAYLAYPNEASRYTKKDPNGDGYRCYGVAGGPAGIRWIGVWAPGVPGAPYPAGTGIRVPPGSKIILQAHYNVLTNQPAPDQSAVEFMLADSVKQQALFLPWANPSWFSRNGMKIPAGQSAVKHDFSIDLIATAFPLLLQLAKQNNMDISKIEKILKDLKSLTIHTAMLHMHLRGAAGQLYIERARTKNCMLNIPRWDFNWQLGFDLKKPITIRAGDSLGISCTFDNSAANQPVIDGVKQKPVDVFWGDGTNDEMCLGVLYVTCNGDNDQPLNCPDIGSLLGSFL